MDKPDDVVWWSRTGTKLHRDPDCPPFLRARAKALWRMQHGDFDAADLIRSFDFNESEGTDGNQDYPPEGMQMCDLCGKSS